MSDYKAAHIVNIYKRNLAKHFWDDVDTETLKRMGRRKLSLCWKIISIKPEYNKTVAVEEYVQAIADRLCSNYARKNGGAIGTVSPENYQIEMRRVLAYLPIATPSKTEA